MTHVNKELFLKRAGVLYSAWEEGKYGFDAVDSIAVILGPYEDDPYYKTTAFQTWLFNGELVDTLTVLTKTGIYILASNKKADFFNPVVSDKAQGNIPPVKAVYRNKEDKDASNFKQFISYIQDAGNNVGCFVKDTFKKDFYESWTAVFNDSGFNKVDVSGAFARLFAVKDSIEVKQCREAGTVAVNTWTFTRKRLLDIIDQEKKIKHAKLASELEENFGKVSVQGALSKKDITTAYSPIVMSGGQYSFKWSHESSEKTNIHYGCIISSLGVRLEDYCANLTRTMLVNPSKNIEESYEHILATEIDLISFLRPGARFCDVFDKTVKALRERDPALADNLYQKEFGFCTGLQFREAALTISPKCQEKVRAGMVFVVYVGVEGLTNKNSKDELGKKFAIAISDTVMVNEEGANDVLTDKAKSRLKSVVIRFTEEAEEPSPSGRKDDNKENSELMPRGKRSVVLNDQTRNKATNEEKRKLHQKELMLQLNESAKERLSMQRGSSSVKKVKKSNVSYKSYDKFPQESDINKLQIYVDRRHDTIIMPIFGVPVPFHISMIKNCSQSVEGDFTYLRINFAHPGSQIGKDQAQFPHPLATYLKEMTYRASNMKEHGQSTAQSHNLSNAYRLIKEIQKRFRTEEAEEREKEGAIKQDKLVLAQGKANPRLKDLYVRPSIIQKRISGSLEAHINGFRYTSIRGDRIDVLYNNIKHAFFQPCDNEMIILLHFHLKHPVLWGKKKYKDVQFYTEVGEITTDLGKYHHMQDRDDVQSEQVEREMRRKLNQAFQNFCDKVVKQTNDLFDFDTPFSELGFFGVPHRSSCTLKPTSTSLVNLTEWPTFIITLDDVELVHFERVAFSMKNFDMVFIFKDYSRKVQFVQQIPMTSLDNVKEWLNSCDLKYNEGLQSLNWPKIMKTILDDPDAFFEDGGWSFLDAGSDDEVEEDESESDDGYNPTDDEEGSDEEDSDEESEEGDVTSSEDDDGSLDSDESEGKDWSDLEEEAARADKRKEQEDGGVDNSRDRHRDRKRPSGHSGHSSSKHGGPHAKRRK